MRTSKAHSLVVGRPLRQCADEHGAALHGAPRRGLAGAALGADQQLDHAFAVLSSEDQLGLDVDLAFAADQHQFQGLAIVLALLHRAQPFLDLALLVGRDQIDQRLARQVGRIVVAEQVGEGQIGAGDNAFLHVRHCVGGPGRQLLVAGFEVGQTPLGQPEIAQMVVFDELPHHHRSRSPGHRAAARRLVR
jgi:hypothetical protein